MDTKKTKPRLRTMKKPPKSSSMQSMGYEGARLPKGPREDSKVRVPKTPAPRPADKRS